MRFLRQVWIILAELAGEADYQRYCAHVRRHHPDREILSAKEFYLARLSEKYTRPTRCC